MFRFRSSKLFIVVLVVIILATSAYAFAAALTFDPSMTNNAGEGTSVIGGYVVNNVTYTYSTANPSLITDVEFDIAPAAAKASVGFNAGLLTNCTLNVAGTHATCTGLSQGVLGAASLRIVASD